MHRKETVEAEFGHAASGMNATEVARALGVHRETVRDWIAGALPSDDIRRIFCDACDLLGLRYTLAKGTTINVSRKTDVATLDTFIGSKR